MEETLKILCFSISMDCLKFQDINGFPGILVLIPDITNSGKTQTDYKDGW